VPSVDIDRDAARQAAQDELSKPIYPKSSPGDQFNEWLNHLILRLMEKSSSIHGGWFTVTMLFILLAVAVAVGVHIARNTMRTNRGDGDYRLFEAAQLTAAQHRATAEDYAAQGNWAAAIRHRLRAVARQLEESGVLEPAPGRTANELARDAGSALPHLAGELSRAATAFNDVTYGEQPGTPDAYQMIAELDDHLRSRATADASVTGAPAASDSWAQVH
jgi:hypothetical protein